MNDRDDLNPESKSSELESGSEQNANAAFFWLRSKRTWFLVLLILVLVPYGYTRIRSVTRMVQSFSDTNFARNENSAGNEIKLLVYNIAHGRGLAKSNWSEGPFEKKKRVIKIAEFIRNLDFDIAILNEVDFHCTWTGHMNQAKMIANLTGTSNRVQQRNLDFGFVYGAFDFGNAMLSKIPVKNSSCVEYPPYRIWESWLAGHKKGLFAELDWPDDSSQKVQLVAVHLEHRDEESRIKAIRKIFSTVGDGPAILAGDFNSTPEGFPGHRKSRFDENSINLIVESDRWKTFQPMSPGESVFTFPSDNPNRTIDWVFVSHHFEMLEYQVLDSQLSDHLPVLVRLRLKDEKPDAVTAGNENRTH
ncbi:MAG: endonuclease/exonuclease/phosphatase family protein [Planctomycetota bacterium]